MGVAVPTRPGRPEQAGRTAARRTAPEQGRALSQGWSVLVRGRAHHVTHPAELQIVRNDAAIWPWPGGDRDVYVRLIPDIITGRRIESR
jgi:hypothetical protein